MLLNIVFLVKKFSKLLLRLFRVLIGYPIYWLSGFFVRNKKVWVFGSYGIFNDNSKYLYQFVSNNPQYNIRAIWISRNRTSVLEAKEYGEAYWLYSFNGIYYSLFAGAYIFSSYINDINFFLSRKVYKVNLWHGIPLKKIEFDITTKPLVNLFREANLFYKLIYPHLHIKYDLVLSPSKFVADYSFKSAFKLSGDNNIVIAPYPRLIYSLGQRLIFDIDFSRYNKVFFYAPTWRDYDKTDSRFGVIDFNLLNNLMMQYNSLLIIKFHAATNYKREAFEGFSFIKVIDNDLDPMDILSSVDVLITDYSSIYFDFLYLTKAEKIIVYFPFDLDEYLVGREMYFSYSDVTPGPKIISFDDLLAILNKILLDDYVDDYKEDRRRISNLFNGYNNLNEIGSNLIINRILDEL